MKSTACVYLVNGELYSHEIEGSVSKDNLMGIFPLAAFSGTDKGLTKAKSLASDLNRFNVNKRGDGCIAKEHHSTSESRYWVDFGDVVHHDFQVFVVRRVDKK